MPAESPNRLAVYGSLAPGKENHWVLKDLKGTWSKGTVRGHLHQEGWGAAQGYPAMRFDPSGQEIDVQVFESDDLPKQWQRIDEFEGVEYQRTLVPVAFESGEVKHCYIYALNEAHGFTRGSR